MSCKCESWPSVWHIAIYVALETSLPDGQVCFYFYFTLVACSNLHFGDDVFKSTMHRAINYSGRERYSIPLFFGTDYDVLLEVRIPYSGWVPLIQYCLKADINLCLRRIACEIWSCNGWRICEISIGSYIFQHNDGVIPVEYECWIAGHQDAVYSDFYVTSARWKFNFDARSSSYIVGSTLQNNAAFILCRCTTTI